MDASTVFDHPLDVCEGRGSGCAAFGCFLRSATRSSCHFLVDNRPGLPAVWKQLLELAGALCRHPLENVLQVTIRIVSIELGRLDEAHDISRPLARSLRSGESQFDLLCMAVHNRRYARPVIMHCRCLSPCAGRSNPPRIRPSGPMRKRGAHAPAVHNHRLFRNSSVRSDARYRNGLVAGDFSAANARAFIARSASTY